METLFRYFLNSQKWSLRARLFLMGGVGILGRQAACASLSGGILLEVGGKPGRGQL